MPAKSSTWRLTNNTAAKRAVEKQKIERPVNFVFPFRYTYLFKVTRPSFFFLGGGVPSYFEALWYPHLYFYRKSNT